MPQANILNSAVADLADIWAYIALDSPDNTDLFIDRIFRI
jgi:plasmid stabilization system protein ParE